MSQAEYRFIPHANYFTRLSGGDPLSSKLVLFYHPFPIAGPVSVGACWRSAVLKGTFVLVLHYEFVTNVYKTHKMKMNEKSFLLNTI